MVSILTDTVALGRSQVKAYAAVGDSRSEAIRKYAQDMYGEELAAVVVQVGQDIAKARAAKASETETAEELLKRSREVLDMYARLNGLPTVSGTSAARAPAQLTAGSKFKYSDMGAIADLRRALKPYSVKEEGTNIR